MAKRGRPFEKGNPGGPGRPKGSRNKLTEDFLTALQSDFSENGEEAIVQCRQENVAKYLDIITKVIPRDVNINVSDLDSMTEAELEARTNELLKRLTARAAGDSRGAGAEAKPKQTH